MILRIDRLAIERPRPKAPSANAAAAVQELLGGKFGEMSTLINYTNQLFNFRGRSKLRPFYDLSDHQPALFGHDRARRPAQGHRIEAEHRAAAKRHELPQQLSPYLVWPNGSAQWIPWVTSGPVLMFTPPAT